MKNKIEDLRNHLFVAIESLMDDENPMDTNRAQAIADVAQTIINSAKVEVQFLQATGRVSDSGFLSNGQDALPAPEITRLKRV